VNAHAVALDDARVATLAPLLSAGVRRLLTELGRATAQARKASRHVGLKESALRRVSSLALRAQQSVNGPAGH